MRINLLVKRKLQRIRMAHAVWSDGMAFLGALIKVSGLNSGMGGTWLGKSCRKTCTGPIAGQTW